MLASLLPAGYRVHWPQAIFLVATPLATLWALANVPLHAKTAAFAVVYYFVTGIGITGGYHRLWAHKAYDAALPYRVWMALAGAGAVQGSIRWWSRGHRAHHRYTDTDKDPYGVHRGLFWAHMGWMLVQPKDKKAVLGQVDMADLDRDWLVRLQHRVYVPLALFMAFGFPTLVCGLGWGDWLGGYFFAGVARLVVVHHATFCVNSLAHYLGEATYDDVRSPRDHIITAFVTLGEGYHNFHHEYPNDYRNAIRWWQYDPTKWVIRACSWVGLTYNLREFPDNEVQKGALTMQQKKLDAWRAKLNWGKPVDALPVWDHAKFAAESAKSPLILIDGVAHTVAEFAEMHPGGKNYIRAYTGKDATRAFNGGVYKHATAARNLLASLRVARVVGPGDEAGGAAAIARAAEGDAVHAKNE